MPDWIAWICLIFGAVGYFAGCTILGITRRARILEKLGIKRGDRLYWFHFWNVK